MKRRLLTASVIAVAIGVAGAQEKRLKEDIACERAVQLIQEHEHDAHFVILDVRTPEEFSAGHLKRAEIIDFKAADFGKKLEELDRSKTFLVYCRKGVRSATAIRMMRDLGFTSIFHLYEGYDVWKSKGNATIM